MWWSDSHGYIELHITRSQAASCSHPGPCDADVAALRQSPVIRRQLARLDPEKVRKVLREYGAWDDADLADHDANLSRLLWVACNDINDAEKMV